MKKLIALLLTLALAFSLAACGGNSTSQSNSSNGGSASGDSGTDSGEADPGDGDTDDANTNEDTSGAEELSGTVATNGSTSMDEVINALSEAFMELHPDVVITYEPTGSGSGITAATEGSTDIGLSSRKLHDDETGITGTVIALDGIAVIVHPSNTVTDLTLEQIKGLFDGTITNWSEVGGPDAPVVPIGREAGSGTRDGFESVVGVEDVCLYQQELTSTGAVITAVAGNENAIGYASLSAVNDSITPVTVDGVIPSEDTVKDGSYTLQRPFLFVTNDSKPLSPAAQAFADFALSSDAAEIIANAGAIQP